jgi:hypothetical protein
MMAKALLAVIGISFALLRPLRFERARQINDGSKSRAMKRGSSAGMPA